MFRIRSRRPLLADPDDESAMVPRSAFLACLGLGVGTVILGAGALLAELFTSAPALAARKPRLSVGFTMPAVSKIGLFLGNAAALKPNQSLAYTDPRSGDPAILIRLASGRLVSYDMVCPHRGCAVPYDPTRRLLVCPCHGAQFDPARGAAPLSGPVAQPLLTLPIRVDAAGNVYALDAHPGRKINRLHAAPAPSRGGDDGSGDDSNKGRHKRKGGGDD